jgi:hypothetical protein
LASPILAALLTPDQSRPGVRRLLAAGGLVAFLLGLGVRADPLALLFTAAAGVLLTALAFHADDTHELRRFAVVNGLAMLLLVWGTVERPDLVVERNADQLSASIGTVRLGGSIWPGSMSGTGQDRIAIAVGGVDARPVVAAWDFDRLPSLGRFGYWLAGGMRASLGPVRVTDPAGQDLIPPLPYLLQPDDSTDAPLLRELPDGWTLERDENGAVLLVNPPIPTDQFRLEIPYYRPSAFVAVSIGMRATGPSLDVRVGPDRRLFEIVACQPDGRIEPLVGGPFTYRRTVVGWLQALVREVGRAWLVALALVAASRLIAFRLPATLPSPVQGVGDIVVLIVASVIGLAALMLT